jgi:hypothetical protein
MSDPASASALAIPNPMPLLPPVTIDILLSKRNFSIMIFSIEPLRGVLRGIKT